MIPIQHVLRRRMMRSVNKSLSISSLPLGTLIRIADSDGGDGVANYEIADINNLVPGSVVLVRKNIYSNSRFGSTTNYPGGDLDNEMTSIYNSLPEKLQSKIMNVTFDLEGSGSITRKMFALTYTMAGFGNNNGVAEGKALQLYKSNASRIKTFNGSADRWWLSSQIDSYYAWRVISNGSTGDHGAPDYLLGVVPAFAISQSVMLEGDANEDGSYNLIMVAEDGSAPIVDLPLGTLINVGTDGGAGTPNYEIADKDNLVSGGVVLVRKNIYSNSRFGSNTSYPNGTLDNLIKTTIYNEMPQQLRDKMMNISFNLYNSENITRKMFALTYTMAGFGKNNGVAEGKALQLYTSNASRVKTFNGSADFWWLSSQIDSKYAWRVDSGGATNSTGFPTYSKGVVPAFVIPSETPYAHTPNTDGSYNLIL